MPLVRARRLAAMVLPVPGGPAEQRSSQHKVRPQGTQSARRICARAERGKTHAKIAAEWVKRRGMELRAAPLHVQRKGVRRGSP
jgi:hypothetical protein